MEESKEVNNNCKVEIDGKFLDEKSQHRKNSKSDNPGYKFPNVDDYDNRSAKLCPTKLKNIVNQRETNEFKHVENEGVLDGLECKSKEYIDSDLRGAIDQPRKNSKSDEDPGHKIPNIDDHNDGPDKLGSKKQRKLIERNDS
jgi:hypothetical protein